MDFLRRGLDGMKHAIVRYPRALLVFKIALSLALVVALLFGTPRFFVNHPNWQPYLRELPDFSAYPLAAIGATLPFLSELVNMLERKKGSRWIFTGNVYWDLYGIGNFCNRL